MPPFQIKRCTSIHKVALLQFITGWWPGGIHTVGLIWVLFWLNTEGLQQRVNGFSWDESKQALCDLPVFTTCRYQPSRLWVMKGSQSLIGYWSGHMIQLWWKKEQQNKNKSYSRRQMIMLRMTVLLILVWNVSVNIAFMALHAVPCRFRHCGVGFLKLACSEDQRNCYHMLLSTYNSGLFWVATKKETSTLWHIDNNDAPLKHNLTTSARSM